MNWADWAILSVLGLSALISVIRGFVKEAVSLLIWVAAAVVASVFYERLAVWLVDLIDPASLRLLVSWVGLFVAVLIVGGLVNFLLGHLVKATGLSGTDRLLGLLFGVARGLIIVMAVLILLPGILPVQQDDWWQQSVLIPEFLRFESWARDIGSSFVNFFKQLF
ncbi:MAG: CvpA family protein [Porticoccaceae bacterium]|nr:CvpA family protein [Pseudomonadales bacterium]MCP5171732.1 CvpA family protein [Pseudomonadales bacterium]